MTSTFDFSDWFSDKKEYHRIFVPDNLVMEYMALYAFNSGTLYDTLLTEKMVCVSGDESIFNSDLEGTPGYQPYDEDFAKMTFDKIMGISYGVTGEYARSGVVSTYLVATTEDNILSKDYTSVVHNGEGVAGALDMYNEHVILPSGSGYINPTYSADGQITSSGEYFDDAANWNEREEFVTDVQTSVNNSGLHWTVPLCFQLGTSGVDGMDCTKCSEVTFHLHLYDIADAQSERRSTALKGNGTDGPLIVAAPSTAYGRGGSASSIPGRYEDVEEGGVDNPKNTVAAPMNLHYNQNTGKFESGTTSMLCILLSELEGINIVGVDVPQVHKTPIADMIMGKEESEHYLGAHNLGRAMPIGVKGANPNHFGPDGESTGCQPSEKKNIIVVVNRSDTNYATGERVLVQKIDGEWLVTQSMESTDSPTEGTFKVGKWGPIYHGMAPASQYMRNATVPQPGWPFHRRFPDGDSRPGQEPVVSEQYESYFRETFYYDLAEATEVFSDRYYDMNDMAAISKINGSGVHGFRPSKYHWQFTSFDQMSDDLGGNNDYNLLGNTNPLLFSNGEAPGEEADTWDLFPFAGMTFPDGYMRSDVLLMETASDAGTLHLSSAGRYAEHYLTNKTGAKPFDSTTVAKRMSDPYCEGASEDGAYIEDEEGYIGGNEDGGESACTAAGGTWMPGVVISEGGGKNANVKGNMFQVNKSTMNVPADIALNASPSGINGSPIESLAFMKDCLNFGSDFHLKSGYSNIDHSFYNETGTGPRVNLVVGTHKYLNSQDRYSWLTNGEGGTCSVGDPDTQEAITNQDRCEEVDGDWSLTGFSTGDGSTYDWAPAKKSKIAFVPLTAEQYTSYDMPNPIFFWNKSLLAWPFQFDGEGLPPFTTTSPAIRPDGHIHSFDLHGSKFFDRETGHKPPFDDTKTSFRIVAKGISPDSPQSYDILPYLGMVGMSDNMLLAYHRSHMVAGWAQSSQRYQGGLDWDDKLGYYLYAYPTAFRAMAGAFGIGFTTSKVNVKSSAGGMRFIVDMKDIGMDYQDKNLQDLVSDITDNGAAVAGAKNATPQWGRRDDNPDSLNTTALWVRIADAHPPEQTIYDPRYHAIMNFNPGELGSDISTVHWKTGEDGTLTINGEPITSKDDLPDGEFGYKTGFYSVDQQDYPEDFRIPTYIDASIVPTGMIVHKDSLLRDKNHWAINPIRRGMLLPFNFSQRTIGIELSTLSIEFGGTGYKKGEVMQSKGGSGGGGYFQIASVDSLGAITALNYANFQVIGGGEQVVQEDQRGFGYSHEDFSGLEGSCSYEYFTSRSACIDAGGAWTRSDKNRVYLANYTGGESSIDNGFIPKGVGAEIYATEGIVWDKFTPDVAPQTSRHQKLSAPSLQGYREPRHGRADTGIVTEMTIESPNSKGEYDIYFHFHNDISYTLLGEPSRSPNWVQHLTCDFSPVTI